MSCILLAGCVATPSSREKMLNENLNIFVKETDAWFDMMPVIEPQKEGFRFLIDLTVSKLENSYIAMDTANFSVGELEIHFNNYAKGNRRFIVERGIINANTISLRIYHTLDARYTDKEKQQPADVYFVFNLYYQGELLRKITTTKISIKKVY
jgi:hypothetical protein